MGCYIQFNNVSHDYVDRSGGVVCALGGVSLSISRGEFVAVIGHNGSGKSTLAKHMNALLLPSSGSVRVDGFDTKDPANTWEIRRRVAFVFQNPDNQIVASTVEEDVAFGPENLGLPKEDIRSRIDESLATVGMSQHALRAPYALSGGQKQRVAIAGALAMKPECIVLDEPTAMLDPQGRREVMSALKALASTYSTTIVLVTHHMAEAAQADRILILDSGHLVLDGTPKHAFSDESVITRLGLELPLPVEMSRRLRALGLDIPFDTINEDELVDTICRLYSKM